MTTPTATTGLLFEPIPATLLERARRDLLDEASNPLVPRPAEAGDPLRCCLRAAQRDERTLLMAYTPPGTAGAYAERGPVFVHAEACEGYPTPWRYPPTLAHLQQVVRAYDHEGRIADGVLAEDGTHAVQLARAFLARSDIAIVHLRNVGYGCYNFAVRRP